MIQECVTEILYFSKSSAWNSSKFLQIGAHASTASRTYCFCVWNLSDVGCKPAAIIFDMAESLDISYAHYSQIEQGRHRMSLELMLKIVSKYDVDPNTLLGIIRKDDENKMIDILNEKLKMLSHAEREYVIFTFLIFMKGFDVYELHIK